MGSSLTEKYVDHHPSVVGYCKCTKGTDDSRESFVNDPTCDEYFAEYDNWPRRHLRRYRKEQKSGAEIKKPIVGDIVHFTTPGGPIQGFFPSGASPLDVCAALVTKVNPDGTVSLRVYHPRTVDFWLSDIEFTESPSGTEAARGYWSWPSRE